MSGTVTTYLVAGMTCSHCVTAVTEEVTEVEGVRDVAIDLVPGGESSVRVTSEHPVDVERIRAAVDEAGYQLVGP